MGQLPPARHPSSRVPHSRNPGPEPDNKSPLPWLQAAAAVTSVSDLLGPLLRDQELLVTALRLSMHDKPDKVQE